MAELTPLAKKIKSLNELREESNGAVVANALQSALSDRSQRVIAKAAELCGELQLPELMSQLLDAYQRMYVNPLKKDLGCLAKTAIVTALTKLECPEVDPFRRGVKYEQFEPVWGGQEDTAPMLRAACAAGMVGCAPRMEAILCCADLLADRCRPARIGAARALHGLGHWEGVPLLRLKLQSGDDPEVLGECASALLGLAPDESRELVMGLLSSPHTDVRVQAAFALGEARSVGAFEPICDCWRHEQEPATRGLLMTCIGLLRSPESRQFLIAQIDGPDPTAAADAIRALAPYALIEELREAVEAAVENSDSQRLRGVFEDEFG